MTVFDSGRAVAATPRTEAEEREHWLDRAEAHLDLGRDAEDRRAGWAHLLLAEHYLDRVYGEREDA